MPLHIVRSACGCPADAASGYQSAFTVRCRPLRALADSAQVGLRVLPIVVARSFYDTFFAPRDSPVRVNLLGHPGDIALMNAPDVVDSALKLIPEGTPEENNAVGARIALEIVRSFPGALTIVR